MILEHVCTKVNLERASDYLAAFSRARPLVLRQQGCLSCRLLPKVGENGTFLLLIEWETKSAHTEGFRKSIEYAEWSELLHPFYTVFPAVDYYQI